MHKLLFLGKVSASVFRLPIAGIILRTMKIATLLLLVFITAVRAEVSAQQVSLHLKNAPITDVFAAITKQTNYQFLYSSKVVKQAAPVSIHVVDMAVADVLETITAAQHMTFKMIAGTITVKMKPGDPDGMAKPIGPNGVGNRVQQDEIDVTGVVKDELGEPLSGASVVVKGQAGIGTRTDQSGHFSLRVPNQAVLVISFVGYDPIEIVARSGASVDVALEPSASDLDEVVVTALGITREKKTLGYASQSITGSEANVTRVSNVASGLSGKVSGLQIGQGNSIGGSVNVVIRGAKSLTGNNQALFVIDGVPIDNSTNNASGQQRGGGGYDYGNAAADINPDDIESINVLKGAAASALYGSRAANGVIMITTKKARQGLGITLNSGTTVGQIDKSTFVKYQQEYGAGRSDPYDRDGFLYFDANGDGTEELVVPTFAPRSWGPRYDPNLMVFHWDAFDPTSPYYMTAKPWVAPRNGPETFFETAVSTNNSIMVDGGTDKGTFKLGYVRNDERGTVPNSQVLKNIVNFAASYNLTDKLTASAVANYSQINGKGRYGTGYDASRNVNVTFRQFGQTNVDIQEQKDAYFRTRKNITWNWADPSVSDVLTPAFNNNIYWIVYENFQNDQRNRIFGNASLNYQVNDWLNIMGRVSVDNYSEYGEEREAVGSIGVSSYSRFDRTYNETNYDLMATVDKELSADFRLNGVAGVNLRRNSYRSISQETSGGLVVPGLYSIANSQGTVPAPTESYQPKAVDGYFAGFTLGYREFLTLDASVRRDISSTLPKNANAYNYYAVSASWLFSQHLGEVDWLSSGKIRANYATVGNDAPWGSLMDIYDKPDPFGSGLIFSLPGTKNNEALKPENTTSREIGLELAFFNNRLGLDATYYHTNTVNQIIPMAVSTATGYSSKFVNAGDIENKGVEVSLYATPVRTNDFSWNVNLNFTRNRNKVVSLNNDSKNIQLASFQGGVSLNATVGEPYGILQGATFQLLDGQPLVNAGGTYAVSSVTSTPIGNVNPDWIGGVYNSLRYKNVRLNFLVDVKQGGDVFSLDMYYGQASGILAESVGLNDLGNPVRDPVEAGGGIILPGVTADGQPNTKRVTIDSNNSYVLPQSEFVYDASYVKLREVSLGYSLPGRLMDRIKYINGIELSLIGRNLWLIHKNIPYADPEENLSAGNIQGYQSGSYPTTRTFGLNVKLTF